MTALPSKKSFLCFTLPFLLLSCASIQDPITTQQNATSKPLVNNSVATIDLKHAVVVSKAIPSSYTQWLAEKNHAQQVSAYENFLAKNHVANVAPSFELFRTARDWQKCAGQEYAIPNQELWPNQVATLKVLKQLIEQHILKGFEVTSVYRDLPTNQCAGGANESRHLYNSAIDFRIGPAMPQDADLEQIASTKVELCKFWQKYGANLNLGLGVYASGQIHIDTQGYRTWGALLNHKTSTCTL